MPMIVLLIIPFLASASAMIHPADNLTEGHLFSLDQEGLDGIADLFPDEPQFQSNSDITLGIEETLNHPFHSRPLLINDENNNDGTNQQLSSLFVDQGGNDLLHKVASIGKIDYIFWDEQNDPYPKTNSKASLIGEREETEANQLNSRGRISKSNDFPPEEKDFLIVWPPSAKRRRSLRKPSQSIIVWPPSSKRRRSLKKSQSATEPNNAEHPEILERPDSVRFTNLCKAILAQRNDQSITCPIPGCSQELSRLNVKRHLRSHLKERRYQCPYKNCGLRFSVKSCALLHLNTHKEVNAENNKVHSLIDSYIRKFDALYRPTKYLKAADKVDKLTQLVKNHFKKRRFRCPIDGCNKIFDGSNLRRHLGGHFRIDRETCPICGTSLHHRNLLDHLQFHKEQISYQDTTEKINRDYEYLEKLFLPNNPKDVPPIDTSSSTPSYSKND